MRIDEVRPGLHRWTAAHRAAEPDPEPTARPIGGCVAYEGRVALLLVDPLVPGDRVLGDEAGGLRLCPQSWLGYRENG